MGKGHFTGNGQLPNVVPDAISNRHVRINYGPHMVELRWLVDAQSAFLSEAHLLLCFPLGGPNDVSRIRSISGHHLHPYHG